MEEILHQLIDGLSIYPTIYRLSTILLVVQAFATIHSIPITPITSSTSPITYPHVWNIIPINNPESSHKYYHLVI
jgi:hypothetical protein